MHVVNHILVSTLYERCKWSVERTAIVNENKIYNFSNVRFVLQDDLIRVLVDQRTRNIIIEYIDEI